MIRMPAGARAKSTRTSTEHYTCARCGITKTTNTGRPRPTFCRDCIEADPTMTRPTPTGGTPA